MRIERLCADAAAPDDASDTTFIDCEMEGASFSTEEPSAKDELVVLAYNILRGFEVDGQLEMIRSGIDFPVPDILLLSEVDRGCARTDFRNIAREYAEGLGYHYVYATEFLELPGDRGPSGPYDPPVCEHGNAIVSRYPLGNVRQIRHAQNRSWYMPPGTPNPDEPRLGGRITIAADAKIGTRLVRIYVLHLESTLTALDIRDAQAEEIAADSEVSATRRSPAVISTRSSTSTTSTRESSRSRPSSRSSTVGMSMRIRISTSSTATRPPIRSTWSST